MAAAPVYTNFIDIRSTIHVYRRAAYRRRGEV